MSSGLLDSNPVVEQGAGGIEVVQLARALGFQIDQVADEGDNITWRWLAKGGTAAALKALDENVEAAIFSSDVDAAKGAILRLTVALDALVDGPEFRS
jgi:hypothetical protein